MRESWTDDRIDDLSRRMDERFDRVDERFRQVDERFDRVETEIKDLRTEMNMRFDALHRTMIQFSAGMLAAVSTAMIGLIATQL